MILYHYTSKTSFDNIMQTKTILPSDPWTTDDSSYGRGYYFTDLPPEHCDAWKVAHCWKSLSVFEKVEYYLKFDVPDAILKHCRQHVYMISTWDNRIKYLEGKVAPKCGTATSCFICKVINTVKNFLGLK
jgi:hypothetical protein